MRLKRQQYVYACKQTKTLVTERYKLMTGNYQKAPDFKSAHHL